jgi:hypothetical protein
MQYVLMAIPTQLVPQVAALMADFDVTGVQVVTERQAGDNGSMINGWTEDLVRRAFKESGDPMRRVLLFLAQHADQEVTATQIGEAIEAKYGWNTVAGMLGAFGRRSVNKYKRPKPMWEVRQGPDGGLLKMPVAVAGVIEAAAAEA